MDLQSQQRVKDAAEKYGAETVVIILGSSDGESVEMFAETVTVGDPTFTGPLSGVSLGLPVYHVFEEEIRAEADPSAWKEHVGALETALDTDALSSAVAKMREEHGGARL